MDVVYTLFSHNAFYTNDLEIIDNVQVHLCKKSSVIQSVNSDCMNKLSS